MEARPLSALVLAAAAASTSCLVTSRCVGDDDCWGNERCDATTGACVLECGEGWASACVGDRPWCLVEENRCVACLETDDCGDAEQCLGWSCVPTIAPGFALVDENPLSPSFGEEVSLADFLGRPVLVYFATLG
jgi:hypothetical protein